MNIRDIARLANVTPGTVSKVVNNYPDISEATRQLVLKIIEENQYIPNFGSRSQRTMETTPTVGLVIEGVYNSLHETMEEMLSIRLHNGDYTILSYHDNYFVQDKEEKFQELVAYANKHKLNGIIYFGGNFELVNQSMFQLLPCPTIFVNTVLPDNMGETCYSSVQVNHYEVAFKQMNYLINKGHVNIATLISSEEDTSVYGLRTKAYKEAFHNTKLDHNLAFMVEGNYNYKRSYEVILELLNSKKDITAICCISDVVDLAVIRAIHDFGKIPGKDIEIIGFDGSDEVDYCIPSVTSFHQPKEELVICIYDLLMGLMNKERNHQHITIRAQLVVNESCK